MAKNKNYTVGVNEYFTETDQQENKPETKTNKSKKIKVTRTHINLALTNDLLDDINWVRASLGMSTATATINYMLRDYIERNADKLDTFKAANRIK